MLRLMEEGRGTRAGIPQMIMAGASVDDVFVIVLFMAFTGLAAGGGISAGTLARIPFSIVLGILAGAACGSLLAAVFRRLRLRDSAKVLILLSISFLLDVYKRQPSVCVRPHGACACPQHRVRLARHRRGAGWGIRAAAAGP